MDKIKILLADDHPAFRKGLKSIIESLLLSSEVLEAENGKEVIALAIRHRIDLFILDYKMPTLDGYEAAKILLRRDPSCRILVITMYTDTVLILNFLKLGVKGFLMKNSSIDEIEQGIDKVLAGEVYLNPCLEEAIPPGNFLDKRLTPLKFTARESDLVTLLSLGKTSRDISQSLGLSLKTIEAYRSRLFDKVGVKNTPELLTYCNRNGLL